MRRITAAICLFCLFDGSVAIADQQAGKVSPKIEKPMVVKFNSFQKDSDVAKEQSSLAKLSADKCEGAKEPTDKPAGLATIKKEWGGGKEGIKMAEGIKTTYAIGFVASGTDPTSVQSAYKPGLKGDTSARTKPLGEIVKKESTNQSDWTKAKSSGAFNLKELAKQQNKGGQSWRDKSPDFYYGFDKGNPKKGDEVIAVEGPGHS